MKTLVSVRVEDGLKKQAQKVAADLGFSISALVNAFLRQLVRDKRINFNGSYRMSKKLEKTLERVEKDIKENRNISPAFSSAKEMFAHMKQNDK